MDERLPGAGEDEPFARDPARIVVAAFGLALTCLVVPIAVVGGVFAGFVLMRRNRPLEGAGVIVVSLALTAAGIALLR